MVVIFFISCFIFSFLDDISIYSIRLKDESNMKISMAKVDKRQRQRQRQIPNSNNPEVSKTNVSACSHCCTHLGTHRRFTSSHIALSKQPHLVLPKGAHDRMQHPLIIKQHHVPFLPIVRVHEPGRDPRPLQPVHYLPDGLEIVNDVAVCEVDFADGAGVDLQG